MEAREGRAAMAARRYARQRGPAMPGDAKTIQTGTSNCSNAKHLAPVGPFPMPTMANTYSHQAVA